MQVSATTSGSLVITKGSLPTTSTTAVTVASEDSAATDLICTHHNLTDATTTGLVKNTNAGNVANDTGLVATGKDALTFAQATNGDVSGAVYYKDYVVYIAANGAALSSQDITVKLLNTDAVTKDIMKATSIDFYYASVTTAATPTVGTGTYAGTLNVAGLTPDNTDGTTAQTSITLGTSGVDVPQANGAGAIAVLMRVYVDGGLHDSATSTFIKSAKSADITDVTMAVQFDAADHTSA